MELFIAAFAAGILTILAPCILPLLPVVLGASVVQDDLKKPHDTPWLKPVVITISLGISVILFTLLLKASTSLLSIPTEFWSVISGGLIFVLGASMALPKLWEKMISKVNVGSNSQKLLSKSSTLTGQGKNIATGFALGPVFNSCSPTYLFIVATVLPASFVKGFGLLLTYTIGLCGALLLIAFAGQTLTQKLGALSNPHGTFKRGVGVLLIIVGIVLFFGIEKDIQTYVLEQGWYDPISRLEMSLE